MSDNRGMNPADVARHYVELFNAERHAEMGMMFAEDAIWRPPPPASEVTGGPGIRAEYASHDEAFRDNKLQITAKRYLVDGAAVAAELVFVGAGYSLEVVDVFEVDGEGKIKTMTAYLRPPGSSVLVGEGSD